MRQSVVGALLKAGLRAHLMIMMMMMMMVMMVMMMMMVMMVMMIAHAPSCSSGQGVLSFPPVFEPRESLPEVL